MHPAWAISSTWSRGQLLAAPSQEPANSSHCPVGIRMTEAPERRKRPSRPVRRASQFDRAVDDLMMKKYGRGHIYYGERARFGEGELSAEEEGALQSEDEYLKDDAILVVGGTGRTGQWIALGLLNLGFNVRVFTREFKRAEGIFGPTGANVDVFQGDVSDASTITDAIEGAKGVVISAAPEWWRLGGSSAIEGAGAVSVIEAAANCKSVQRIVLLSSLQDSSTRAKSKLQAENALRACGKPYIIVRLAPLDDKPGGINNVVLRQPGDAESRDSSLSRVDAAQAVCQALVFDRACIEGAETWKNGTRNLQNYVFEVSNDSSPLQVNSEFWTQQFRNFNLE